MSPIAGTEQPSSSRDTWDDVGEPASREEMRRIFRGVYGRNKGHDDIHDDNDNSLHFS
jgi:hypothetical protein